MKYAFVYSSHAITAHGGVKVQAEMWRDGLKKLGHQVDMIGSWDTPKWELYDVILYFGFAQGARYHIPALVKENPNFVIAPIIDPTTPDFIYKFFCKWWGSHKYLRLSSRFHDLWLAREFPKCWLIRSKEEQHYTNYCLERPSSIIKKVPLHFRVPQIKNFPEKESFCFHASRLASANKNVSRLIKAAKKYGFTLKLAGYLNGETEKKWLKDLIGNYNNINYLGEVNEEELRSLYKRAKVFALPSITEGVGMVALEAAAYGCEIVLTKIGAPKEYYEGRAILVDPKSIDDIGAGITKALNEGHSQPELKSYIEKNYSEEVCCRLLNRTICEVLNIEE